MSFGNAIQRFVAIGIFVGLCLFAKPLCAANDKPDVSPAEESPKADLAATQETIEMKYRRFEGTLQQLSEYLRKTDPARAELLVRAIGKSKEGRIADQLQTLTELLKKDQLGDAIERQQAVIAEFQALLELLMSEARKDEIELKKRWVQDLIKDVNKLIGKETDARAETERGANPSSLQGRQKQVSDATEQLLKKIETHDSAKKGAKDQPEGDSNQTPDDSSSPKDGADHQEPGDTGQKKDPDSANKEDKSGKPQKNSKNSSSDGKSKKNEKDSPKKDDDAQKPDQDSKTQGDSKNNSPEDKSESKDPSPSNDESKESKKSDSAEKSEKGKSSSSPSPKDQTKKGKPKKGSAQQGQEQQQPQENGDQPDQDQQSADEQEPQPKSGDKTAGRDELQRAKREMDRAIEELKKNSKKGASEKQDRAIAELMKAKEKLEEILRIVRQEEREMVLAQLEARFRDMLLKQEAVYNATLAIHAVPVDDRTERHSNRAIELARNEAEISLLAEKALTLLKEEGSSVAFPEAVEQIRDDMMTITRRLERVDVSEITQNVEQDTIEGLKEIIEAMQKELEKLKDKKQQPPSSQQPQQQQQKDGLVKKLAEMKMLRSLQYRVNRRTRQLGRLVDGEQAIDPDVINQLKQLSDRQAKVQKATNDLATGKNQ